MARSQRLHPQAGYTFAISTQIEKAVGNREESIYALRSDGVGYAPYGLVIPKHQTLRTASDTGSSWWGCAALTPPYELNREGLNNKIRVIRRSAYGYRNEDYLRLKIIASFLPPLPENARLYPH